jgi:hypothetical protein
MEAIAGKGFVMPGKRSTIMETHGQSRYLEEFRGGSSAKVTLKMETPYQEQTEE